ncbi:MAG: hypothetical protein ABIP94_15460 [Planctomycetota bacterium]
MLRSLIASVLLVLGAAAQAPGGDQPAGPPVEVPTFANPTCPIMGKKVSMPLFIDTELGRFYVCCKPCYKKILANVPAAHQTAYPVVQEVKNTVCPVSGEAIGDDAVDVTLQGYSFKVCCGKCVDAARKQSQLTLTKVTRDKVKDVGNQTCPVDGKPVVDNAFVLIGDTLVHLSSPMHVDAVAKDSVSVLAKAKAIQKTQPPRPKHEHGPQPAGTPIEVPAPLPGKDPNKEPSKEPGKEGGK